MRQKEVTACDDVLHTLTYIGLQQSQLLMSQYGQYLLLCLLDSQNAQSCRTCNTVHEVKFCDALRILDCDATAATCTARTTHPLHTDHS